MRDPTRTRAGLPSFHMLESIRPCQRPVSGLWQVLDSNFSAGRSHWGQNSRNLISLGISLVSITRCYSRVLNE